MDDGLMTDEQFEQIVAQWVEMLERKNNWIRFRFVRSIQEDYRKRGVFDYLGDDIGFHDLVERQARELLADALIRKEELRGGNQNLFRSYDAMVKQLAAALAVHTVA